MLDILGHSCYDHYASDLSVKLLYYNRHFGIENVAYARGIKNRNNKHVKLDYQTFQV